MAGPPDEADLLRRLAALVGAGRVVLTIDRGKLSHIDFPLALEADGNRWVYGLAALTALAVWQCGPPIGAAAAVASVVVYQTIGRAVIARRLLVRIHEQGLTSLDIWRRLWRFGGVILLPDDGEPWQGPDRSWMALVREMTEQTVPSTALPRSLPRSSPPTRSGIHGSTGMESAGEPRTLTGSVDSPSSE
jgi:hypothetical protein